MASPSMDLKALSSRLRSLVEGEKADGAWSGAEKESLAAQLESWLGHFDPRTMGEPELKALAETLVTLKSDAAVSALLSRVRLDLASMSLPPVSRPLKPAATYGQAGRLKAPLKSSSVDKTH